MNNEKNKVKVDADEIRKKASIWWSRTFFHPDEKKGKRDTKQKLHLDKEELVKKIEEMIDFRERKFEYSKHMAWHLLKNKDMLDFGCGSAPDSHYIVRNIGLKSLTIADVVPSNVELSMKHLSPFIDNLTPFLWSHPTDLKKLGMFDAIYANGVFMTMPDEKIVVDELKKHLRKDGFFLIMLYTHKYKPDIEVRTMVEIIDGEGAYTRGHSLEQVKELFGDDMEIIETKTFRKGLYRRYVIRWK